MRVYRSENTNLIESTPEAQAAAERLEKMVETANQALKAAQEFADQTGLCFSFSPDRNVSMDGTYYGKGKSSKDMPDEPYEWQDDSWGWYTSRDSC